jgi:hypothetical protein
LYTILWFSLIESKNEISNKIAFKTILNSDRNLPRKQFRHVEGFISVFFVEKKSSFKRRVTE